MSNKPTPSPDLAIIGGGNAALCAAITAAEAGLEVLILESAPEVYRGGNSRHTRNFRCMHSRPMAVLKDTYPEDEYFDDLLKVTKGNTDEKLARLIIRSSEECFHWMQDHGVRFQPSLSGSLSLARTNAFFMGGGRALVNAYYRTAQKLGVKVYYQAEVTHLEVQGNKIAWVDFTHKSEHGKELERDPGKDIHRIKPTAVVVASGGFQANLEWLTKAWGPPAKNFLIRGTPYNRGVVLDDLLQQGLKSVGDPTQCHAVAIDGRAPKFDGGIVTRLDCVPFSVVVNKRGERFYDEGEDVWPKRYAIWGRLVAAQPDQVSYVIIDSRSINLFMPSVFPPLKSDTLEGLVKAMGLPLEKTLKTIKDFNAACGDTSSFHPTTLDGVATQGITPAKTNWARPITQAPFYGYSLRPGVTFTYLGLKVNDKAQVQSQIQNQAQRENEGVAGATEGNIANMENNMENLWAAGEIMAGSVLGQGYLAGFGMTIGTVFGRIAGREAAAYIKKIKNN